MHYQDLVDALLPVPRFVYLFGYLTDSRCVRCMRGTLVARRPYWNTCGSCDRYIENNIPPGVWERYRGV